MEAAELACAVAGAKVTKDVHEVKGADSFGIITDRTGAMLGLWQPKKG